MRVFDAQQPQYQAASLVAIFAPRFALDDFWPYSVNVVGAVAIGYVVGQCLCMWRALQTPATPKRLMAYAALCAIASFMHLGKATGIYLDAGWHTPVVLLYAAFLVALAGRGRRQANDPNP